MLTLRATCLALFLLASPSVQASDAPVADACESAETLTSLPGDYVEEGHATLMDGSHVYFYENGDCRCSDSRRTDPDGRERYFWCDPIRMN